MSYIKLIRLKQNDDIISFITEEKGLLKLTHPVSVYISYDAQEEREDLVMSNWLPKPLIKKNEAYITNSQILCILEPTENFKEYYLNFLNGFNSVEELADKEEISDLLSSLDAKADNKLH
jgi:hypothetical protein